LNLQNNEYLRINEIPGIKSFFQNPGTILSPEDIGKRFTGKIYLYNLTIRLKMRGNVSYRILLWATILIGTMSQARGQFYDNGQDPASLKWYRIETPHFRLIFPESFLSEANRLAGILDYSAPYVNYSLNSHPKKIPVIIHNQNTFSNGMVVWAPKRVEFYTVPDPNSYPQDELEQLALHELRHVAQLEKINRKFTGALGYVTGELAAGGLSAMIPLWFMEGDAVASETILSHSGR